MGEGVYVGLEGNADLLCHPYKSLNLLYAWPQMIEMMYGAVT